MSAGGEGEPARTKEQIEADLEATREHLSETVDALGHKLDVKSRSREKIVGLQREHGRELGLAAGVAVILVTVLLVHRRRRR